MPISNHTNYQNIKSSHTRINTVPDILLTTISLLLFLTSPKLHLSLSFPRRFAATMSLPYPRNPNNPRNPNFQTPQSLFNWLQPRLPSDSFSTWGTSPGTKNIHNLWLELSHGETTLIDSIPPLRNLEVVCVRVRRNDSDFVLIESRQELSDGSIRKRGRLLSEKMKAGESVELAARRAVREELGVSDEVVRVVMDCYERKVEERSSVSYPGLPACYVLHYVDAVVDGLPEVEFETEEGDEYGEDCGGVSEAVKVKRHFWKWVSADSL